MSKKPNAFIILTKDCFLEIGWKDPDKYEEGGCEVLQRVPDDFVEEAYRAILHRRFSGQDAALKAGEAGE